MLNAVQTKVARGARRVAWVSAGMLLLLVGAGFLTTSAWLVLSTLHGAQFAALVIGLFYVGSGLISLALGTKRQVPAPVLAPPSGPTQPDVFARLAMAFSEGFQVGAAMRR
ncbi:phage holin family protein [Celeribacter sp. SCSIO 80788]|uniref:phage holin family protein n=1 Tax=Celeribacter sp. SCSIO 80788 TaxID=3117013 RepID=UPI003DA4FD99